MRVKSVRFLLKGSYVQKLISMACVSQLVVSLAMVNPAGVKKASAARSQTELYPPAESSASKIFPCLPQDIRADEVVSYGPKGAGSATVEKKLREMKARCRRGKLVDAKRREIRFFRPSCWGNPPPDYLEIRQREDEELAKLKRRYTVVVFGCNPMIQ